MMTTVIETIYCYPIKGLGGFAVEQTELLVHRGIRHDRRFGLAVAESLSALYEGEHWRPWNHCLTLKKNEQLAFLNASVGETADGLSVHLCDRDGYTVAGRPAVAAERAVLEKFLRDFFDNPHLWLVDSEERPLWDEDGVPLSLLNTDSVQVLSAATGDTLDNRRFRANIIFSGMPAWQEENANGDWRIGDTVLTIAGGVPRCAATRVNPQTGARDLNVPQRLYQQRRHSDMGVFAHVKNGGVIKSGMTIEHEST